MLRTPVAICFNSWHALVLLTALVSLRSARETQRVHAMAAETV
jgi:hypothetical protein